MESSRVGSKPLEFIIGFVGSLFLYLPALLAKDTGHFFLILTLLFAGLLVHIVAIVLLYMKQWRYIAIGALVLGVAVFIALPLIVIGACVMSFP